MLLIFKLAALFPLREKNKKKRKGYEIDMIPLLVILIVTGFSMLISCHFSPEITRSTYYLGAAIGLFASGIALDFWNGRNRRYENGIIIGMEETEDMKMG